MRDDGRVFPMKTTCVASSLRAPLASWKKSCWRPRRPPFWAFQDEQEETRIFSRWAGRDSNIRVNMGLWGWVYGCCCDWSQDRKFLSLFCDAVKKGYKLWNQGDKKQEFEESWIVDQFYGDGRNPDSKYLIQSRTHIWGGCEGLI